MKIAASAIEAIRAHGAEGFPYEVCGLLIGRPRDGLITEVRRLRNTEKDQPRVRYSVDELEDMKVRKELYNSDLDVIGYYHSHPNHPAQPSVFDSERSWESYLYVIVSVQDGEPRDLNAFVAEKDRGPMLQESLEVV